MPFILVLAPYFGRYHFRVGRSFILGSFGFGRSVIFMRFFLPKFLGGVYKFQYAEDLFGF